MIPGRPVLTLYVGCVKMQLVSLQKLDGGVLRSAAAVRADNALWASFRCSATL